MFAPRKYLLICVNNYYMCSLQSLNSPKGHMVQSDGSCYISSNEILYCFTKTDLQ